MDLETYKNSVSKFEKGDWNFDYKPESVTLARYASDMLVEVGEMTDQLNKHIYRGKPLDKGEVAGEMMDILFILASISRNLGFNLNTLAEASIQKFEARHKASNGQYNYAKNPVEEEKIYDLFREP